MKVKAQDLQNCQQFVMDVIGKKTQEHSGVDFRK